MVDDGDIKECKKNSRTIKANIKREVRQRCGFGCVICGLPIYEYHHIEHWADTHAHDPEKITLLCSNCHTDYHHHLVSIDQIKDANSNPYNINQGKSSPKLLRFAGNSCRVVIANYMFEPPSGHLAEEEVFVPLIIDTVPIISFKSEKEILLVNLKIYDEENNLCLQIEDNELVYSTGFWDITFKGNTLQINEAAKNIFLKLELLPPKELRITAGKILLNGVELSINNSLIIGNGEVKTISAKFKNCTFRVKFGLWVCKDFDRLPEEGIRICVNGRKPCNNIISNDIFLKIDNNNPSLSDYWCPSCVETINALQLRSKGETANCPICKAEYMKGSYWVKNFEGAVMNEKWQESDYEAYCLSCKIVWKLRESTYIDGEWFPFRCPQCREPLYSRLGEE